MRQRNETGYERHIPVWPDEENPGLHPFSVADGEETDFPRRLGGFTLLPEPEPDPVKPKRKDAAVAAEKEEGEPQ